MLSFKRYITEALDTPYPTTQSYKNSNYQKYRAKTKDGRTIGIEFEPDDGYDGMNIGIVFAVNGSEEITGKGDAFRIFATVTKTILDYVKQVKPSSFGFQAMKVEDANEKESRVKLYNIMSKRLARQTGYRLNVTNRSDQTTYSFYKQGNIKESSPLGLRKRLPASLDSRHAGTGRGSNPHKITVMGDHAFEDILDDFEWYKDWDYKSFTMFAGGSFHDYWEYMVLYKDKSGDYEFNKDEIKKQRKQWGKNIAKAYQYSRDY